MYGMNPYYPQFNPQNFGQPIQNVMTPQPTQMNMQTGIEVVPVTTIQQVEQVGLQPGQRKMVMVQNEPVIAARYADNMGLVTTEYYRLEKFTPGVPAQPQMNDYVTRQEFNEFVDSLKKANMMEDKA